MISATGDFWYRNIEGTISGVRVLQLVVSAFLFPVAQAELTVLVIAPREYFGKLLQAAILNWHGLTSQSLHWIFVLRFLSLFILGAQAMLTNRSWPLQIFIGVSRMVHFVLSLHSKQLWARVIHHHVSWHSPITVSLRFIITRWHNSWLKSNSYSNCSILRTFSATTFDPQAARIPGVSHIKLHVSG